MLLLNVLTLYMLIVYFTREHACLRTGMHDNAICKQQQTSLSCLHQIQFAVRNFTQCMIHYIPPTECDGYHIEDIYEPMRVPFHLTLYKFQKGIIQSLSFNISFPKPSWKRMTFHIKNQRKPDIHLCRAFQLENLDGTSFNGAVYWDCLLFNVNSIENNSFDLYLQDDSHVGGSYSFRVPPLKHFNATTGISDWNVFFYIHHHYFQSTGQLFITLQPAPFPNVSYSIALIKCLNDDYHCQQTLTLSFVIHNSTEVSDLESPITVELKSAASLTGVFTILVRILSPECGDAGCATSFSPIYEIKRSYKVEIAVGLLVLAILIALFMYLFIHRIHQYFLEYIKKKEAHRDSVLLIYHPHCEAYLELIRHIADILKRKCCVEPLMVDDHVGTMKPDEWTRMQLSAASRVIFVVPHSLQRESVTPIRHQWVCATKHFAGIRFQTEETGNRCSAVLLASSLPLSKGNKISCLPQFHLPKELVALADWLHRSSLLDRWFFWPSFLRDSMKELQAMTSDCDSRSAVKTSFILASSKARTKLPDEGTSSDDEGSESAPRGDFDPMIPDVRSVDSDFDGESLTSDRDSANIINFID